MPAKLSDYYGSHYSPADLNHCFSDGCEWVSHIAHIGLSENKLVYVTVKSSFWHRWLLKCTQGVQEAFFPSPRSTFCRQGFPAWRQSGHRTSQLIAILCGQGLSSPVIPVNGLGLHSIILASTACPHLGNHTGEEGVAPFILARPRTHTHVWNHKMISPTQCTWSERGEEVVPLRPKIGKVFPETGEWMLGRKTWRIFTPVCN